MIHPENSYELPPIISHREIRFLQIFLEIGSTNPPGISVSDFVGMLLKNFSGIFLQILLPWFAHEYFPGTAYRCLSFLPEFLTNILSKLFFGVSKDYP